MESIKKSIPWFTVILLLIIAFFRNSRLTDYSVAGAVLVWAAYLIIANHTYWTRKIMTWKRALKRKKISKQAPAPQPIPSVNLEAEAALHQLERRITELLQIAFPDAKWEWDCESPQDLAVLGGHGQILLNNAGEFGLADILLDDTAHLQFRLLQTTSIMNMIRKPAPGRRSAKPTAAPAAAVPKSASPDVQAWYDTIGSATLLKLVTELNSQGCKRLLITEGGDIITEQDGAAQKWAQVDGFPAKEYWSKLIEIFAAEEMRATVEDNRLCVSWG